MLVRLGTQPANVTDLEAAQHFMFVRTPHDRLSSEVALTKEEFHHLLGLLQNPAIPQSNTAVWVVVHRYDDPDPDNPDPDEVGSVAYRLEDITQLETRQEPIPTEY